MSEAFIGPIGDPLELLVLLCGGKKWSSDRGDKFLCFRSEEHNMGKKDTKKKSQRQLRDQLGAGHWSVPE